MFVYRLFTFVVLLIILPSVTGLAQNSQDRHFTSILDSSLQASQGGNYKVMDTLASSARASSNPRQLYVNLLDYYLGAGAGEALEDLIVQEGEHILPLLLKKKSYPLNCRKEYQQICTESIEHRNKRIDRLVEEIQN